MSSVSAAAAERGVRRLCHLTASRHLPSIVDHRGLMSVQALKEIGATFNPNDPYRADGHPDKLCCSVEYPNLWYGRKVMAKEVNFLDWVIIFIDPRHFDQAGALFCPRNAAAAGAPLQEGLEGFSAMYASTVHGSGGAYTRGANHSPAAPTDAQAEVLLPGPVGTDGIVAVAVATQEQVCRERLRLETIDQDPAQFDWVIAPDLYDPNRIRSAVTGERPVVETPWTPEGSWS